MFDHQYGYDDCEYNLKHVFKYNQKRKDVSRFCNVDNSNSYQPSVVVHVIPGFHILPFTLNFMCTLLKNA